MPNFVMTLVSKSSWAKKPRYFHPFRTETFKVISGELNLIVREQYHILKPGDKTVVVDKFVLHSFWNEKDGETKCIAKIYPFKNMEKGLRLTYKFSQDGKINKKNIHTIHSIL